jgi:hypothetical protein
MGDHARKLPPFSRRVLLTMSTPVWLKEEATQRVDRLKVSLALGHVMTKGRTASHTHSTDCANPAILKETHTFKGDRPANDSQVKAISAQMKDHHLCQNFICTSSGERGCLGSCRTGHRASIETEMAGWLQNHSIRCLESRWTLWVRTLGSQGRWHRFLLSFFSHNWSEYRAPEC